MGYSESAVRIRVRFRLGLGLGSGLGLGLGLDSVRGSTISHKMKYLPRRLLLSLGEIFAGATLFPRKFCFSKFDMYFRTTLKFLALPVTAF